MDVIRASAIELLRLNPSVIVVQGARAVPILQQATKTIPIVFVSISDPVGRGMSPTWHGRAAISPDSNCSNSP